LGGLRGRFDHADAQPLPMTFELDRPPY